MLQRAHNKVQNKAHHIKREIQDRRGGKMGRTEVLLSSGAQQNQAFNSSLVQAAQCKGFNCGCSSQSPFPRVCPSLQQDLI